MHKTELLSQYYIPAASIEALWMDLGFVLQHRPSLAYIKAFIHLQDV